MVNDIDVVLSSRIRFALNIKDYPFTSRLDDTSACEIIEKVGKALPDGFTKTDFTDIDPISAESYAESRRVSSEFAHAKLPHVLFERSDTSVMVCEEDHIRLQVIKKGFDLDPALNEALLTDKALIDKLRIAYDSELGFLTHCPTNLGTGMRASVMMFLPGLAMTGELGSIVSQLTKLGLTIRGTEGEGSEAKGHLYQISNARTMGISEESTVRKLSEVVSQMIGYERNARERIKAGGLRNIDPLCRALGILTHARILSSREFVELYAKVRLGIALGAIENIDYEELDALFIKVMPATLCEGKRLDETARDELRAVKVKEILLK